MHKVIVADGGSRSGGSLGVVLMVVVLRGVFVGAMRFPGWVVLEYVKWSFYLGY